MELFVKGDSKTIRWSMKIIFLIACAYFVRRSIWITNDKSLIIVSCTYSRWLKQKYLNSGLDGYYIELWLPARPFWLRWLKQIMFSSFCWQSFHFIFRLGFSSCRIRVDFFHEKVMFASSFVLYVDQIWLFIRKQLQ